MLSLAICIHIALDESNQFIAPIYISFIDWRRSWKRPSVKFTHSIFFAVDSIKASKENPMGFAFEQIQFVFFIVF